ncbi:unnamed protein product [Diatraea saccharalis]|uniref:Uncharacterized protein n=1 Tax=Diatraea saccharalis TaxID=40085 RepID=A0A9N9RCG0_9NEOP|nr:unnamed protein product [Diatraea saccharalis]
MLALKLLVLVLLSNLVFGWRITDEVQNKKYLIGTPRNDDYTKLKPKLAITDKIQKIIDIFNNKPSTNNETINKNLILNDDITTERSNDETTTEKSNNETTTEQSHDNATTTNDVTTENPTTTDEPTKTSEGPEPSTCNSSLYSIKDLELIIDYIVNNSAIFTNIISEINNNTTQIRDIFLGDIKQFYTCLENGIEHLDHILKGFNDTRKKLEPRLKKITESFENYTDLLNSFQDQNNTANSLFEKFKKSNNICEFGCGKSIKPERANVLRNLQTYNPEEYYCGSIEEIRAVILSNFITYSKSLQNEMNDQIKNDIEKIKKEVDTMKNDIKDIILKKFDRTFYDILQLQDDYSHFSENVNKADINKIEEIKLNTAELLPKLMSFKDTLSKFNKFCRACDNDLALHYLNAKNISDETETYNLLNKIIKAKEDEVASVIKENYFNVLKPLKDQLSPPYKIDFNYIGKIYKDVRVKIENEKAIFVNLNNHFDPLLLIKVENLHKESTELLENIDKHTDLINNFMEKK